MVTEESNTIAKIAFVSVFLIIMLLAVVVIIQGLNSGNSQSGQTITGSGYDYLFRVSNTTQTVYTANLTNPSCSIGSIYDLAGNLIPSSNYTINNCQVTYNP